MEMSGVKKIKTAVCKNKGLMVLFEFGADF
jgi:hypothetical protein